MKNIIRILLASVLGLALFIPAQAKIKQVTSVGATASTIVTPGKYCTVLIIQNNGSGDVRLALDGGIVYALTDPTATTGYLLKAGTYLILSFNTGNPAPPIRAILVNATTTTLDIVTNDNAST
jgi:hypothetical protein